MSAISTTVRIQASPEEVFQKATDFAHCEEWVRGVSKLELLTAGPVGVGTRWRETREMFGKQATETMEIAEFEPPRYYLVTAYNCGTHYRTELRFEPVEAPEGMATKVTATFTGTPATLGARILNLLFGWMMKGTVRKLMRQDLEDLQRVIESEQSQR